MVVVVVVVVAAAAAAAAAVLFLETDKPCYNNQSRNRNVSKNLN